MTTLREKMKQEMISRGLSHGTQEQYLRSVTKLHDHYKRSPAKLSEQEIKSFLLFVISNQPCADSTYNIMIHGLKFFYEIVLNRKMVSIILPRKKEPQKLPDILSPLEVKKIIQCTTNLKYRTMLIIAYGAGLRASEVVSLTVKDIDSERSVIHIRQGKRGKDRYVMLSPFMLDSLRIYWKECRLQKPKCQSHHQQKENDFIFPSPSGKPLSVVSKAKNIDLILPLLNQPKRNDSEKKEKESISELMKRITDIDIHQCQRCKVGNLEIIKSISCEKSLPYPSCGFVQWDLFCNAS